MDIEERGEGGGGRREGRGMVKGKEGGRPRGMVKGREGGGGGGRGEWRKGGKEAEGMEKGREVGTRVSWVKLLLHYSVHCEIENIYSPSATVRL